MNCKKCGSNKVDFVKSWKMESSRSGIKWNIKLYKCRACRKSFRVFEK